MDNDGSLLIVLATGPEDGWRKAAIAFGVALAALSTATTVHVFLSLESAVLGTPTGAHGARPRGFSAPIDEYVQHFVDLGGKLEVCSSCLRPSPSASPTSCRCASSAGASTASSRPS